MLDSECHEFYRAYPSARHVISNRGTNFGQWVNNFPMCFYSTKEGKKKKKKWRIRVKTKYVKKETEPPKPPQPLEWEVANQLVAVRHQKKISTENNSILGMSSVFLFFCC